MADGEQAAQRPHSNAFVENALMMMDSLKQQGEGEMEARKKVLQQLLSAFSCLLATEGEKPQDVHEFIAVLAATTRDDPKVKFTHTAWISNDKASDLAQGYGMVAAFGQYWATSVLAKHVHPDDSERAFTDLYKMMEAHINQLREHERQQAMGGDEEEEKTPGGRIT
jgi:hypothetical protein